MVPNDVRDARSQASARLGARSTLNGVATLRSITPQEARTRPAPTERKEQCNRALTYLAWLISGFALVTTSIGIVTSANAHHHQFLTERGAVVTLQGGGLYAYESVSGAAQAIGQDMVTLVVAIPLLLVATVLANRGALAGRLLQAGVFWYFAYTYLLMAFGAAYNPSFLLYVTIYSAALVALILRLGEIDLPHLPMRFSSHFARRTIAWLLLGFATLLAALWLMRILQALLTNTAPAGLDSYSTLFVQAGDLGLVVPLAVFAGVLLLRRRPIGYLLAAIVVVQGATFGLALIAMMVAMAWAGVALAPVEVVFFVIVAALYGTAAMHLFLCLRKPTPAQFLPALQEGARNAQALEVITNRRESRIPDESASSDEA